MFVGSLTVPPSSDEHTHTVVFLHGRGDYADDFSAAVRRSRTSNGTNLYQAFPAFKWVFLQAPATDVAKSPGLHWPQWFDIWNVRDLSKKEELQVEGLKKSVIGIRDVLAYEVERVGGRWDRIVLAGISQGAATCMHVLANIDIPNGGGLGAFLGFSGLCAFPRETLDEMRSVLGLDGVPADNAVLKNTPVLMEHCADDTLVPVSNGRISRDILRSFGSQVEWKEYPDGGHGLHAPDGMDDAVGFIKSQVIGKASSDTTELS
ncbi:Acyl-protein thioesterase 1 [Cytospora mali]|uniref:Acyl-protein thioesterase 1 n=1 Tax=Cytospora mali TaxID=578113 RepID=A0A194VRL5_CYTMA|nr:Acyl-protein thioesterase 1 [Valsa mali]